jgi:hypothetical protein
MLADADVAPVAVLFADPSRVAMLLALSDGREVQVIPAGRDGLARVFGVEA